MKSALLLLAPAFLAACSGGADGNSTAQADPVAAVAAPAGRSWTETVTKTAEGYLMGNPDAPIKLVEYGARTCPTCGRFATEGFKPLTENYVSTGKVSFEFRDYMVHGAPDIALALLGTCGSPATFFPILEAQYANQTQMLDRLQKLSPADQQRLGALQPQQLPLPLAEAMGAIEFHQQRGLPATQARQCLTNQAKLEEVVKPTEAANQAGTVTGTPTFLLNGQPVPNVITWGDLEKALKRAGA